MADEECQVVEVQLRIVNATALQPGKVYLLEVDRTAISDVQVQGILRGLARYGVTGVIARSVGGQGLRVVEPRPEQPERS